MQSRSKLIRKTRVRRAPTKTTTTTTTTRARRLRARATTRSRAFRRTGRRNRVIPVSNSIVDKETYSSTAKLLSSLFVANTGISRGIAFGSQYTALTDIKLDFEINIPAGTTSFLAIQTDNLASPAWYTVANTGTVVGFAGTTQAFNPFNTSAYPAGPLGLGQTSQAFPGPFNGTNPALAWRVVSMSVLITPDASVLNQGGWTKAAHVNDLGNGPITYGAGGVGYAGPATFGDFVNLEQIVTFRGTEAVIYHWYPNDDEVEVNVPITQTSFMQAGPMIALQSSATAAASYNVDIRVGIEYIAGDAYRRLVQRKLPSVHPNAQYEMNQFVANKWEPFVIGTKSAWEACKSMIPDVNHEHSFTSGGSGMFVFPTSTSMARNAILQPYEAPMELANRHDLTLNSFEGYNPYIGSRYAAAMQRSGRGPRQTLPYPYAPRYTSDYPVD